MIDLRFSYDYQIFLNGTLPVGTLHTFKKSLIDPKYKAVTFSIKRTGGGRYVTSISM